MSLLLRHSRDLPAPTAAPLHDRWFALGGAAPDLDAARRLPRLAERLEAAFMASRETWWRLGRDLATAPGGDVAHAPTGGAFGSDLGVMLAWARIAVEEAAAAGTCLAVCDDPWAFRHLAALPGVRAGAAPPLWPVRLRLGLRGWLARAKVAARMAAAALALRGQRRAMAAGDAAILVYGHPRSDAAGFDAYFGDLMVHLPGLKRVLHTDCRPARARHLAADRRGAGLHAWGNPLFALMLVAVRWRPTQVQRTGVHGWLVRRAAARENGGGGPAMNRWQDHCQARWLAAARPSCVAWPWENHAWERALCRTARRLGVPTLGYQHTVVGPHQINYSPAANPDGLASLPDLVACDGPAYRDELVAWGVPAARLAIGGAFRLHRPEAGTHDRRGPVFVPLSAIGEAATQQLVAARAIARGGRRVLVKEHPMYPLDFATEANLDRTETPLAEQRGLAAVLFATGTSGLEAALAGLPAFRLMLDDRIAIDVMPAGHALPAVTVEDAPGAIAAVAAPPPALSWESVLADVDMGFWRRWLGGAIEPPPESAAEEREAS